MPDSPLDDALEAAAEGDPSALRLLYETFAPAVVGYLRARGAREPDDLCSEVFLAVFPRLSTVSGGAAGLRTLLFSVAHARLVDELRRRSRRGDTTPLDELSDPRAAPSAEDEALSAYGVDTVRDVLGQLPPDQRDVLLLRLVGDLTVEQVAETMGKSAGAVKQLQRRGISTLRARFARSGVPL